MPHGLLIDNSSVPNFTRSSEESIFKFVSLQLSLTNHDDFDITSQVKIAAFLESSHHDKNIMTLMAMLNIFLLLL